MPLIVPPPPSPANDIAAYAAWLRAAVRADKALCAADPAEQAALERDITAGLAAWTAWRASLS